MQAPAEIAASQPPATAPTPPQIPTGIRIEGVPGTPAQTIAVPLSADEVRELRELVAASPGNARSDAGSLRGESDAWLAVPVMLIVFVGFPLAFAYARRIWKRAPAARISPAEEGRLERIEQAVEAIAIEVERVSEGQRFVTKLLSDTSRAPLSLPADR